MSEKFEDTKMTVGKQMSLEVKEYRSSPTMCAFKEGYEEVSHTTQTTFHWRLRGLASKFGADVVASDDFNPSTQEVYEVAVSSHGFGLEIAGLKSREDAIRGALAFAASNGIEVDGYKLRKDPAATARRE